MILAGVFGVVAFSPLAIPLAEGAAAGTSFLKVGYDLYNKSAATRQKLTNSAGAVKEEAKKENISYEAHLATAGTIKERLSNENDRNDIEAAVKNSEAEIAQAVASAKTEANARSAE